MADLGRQAWRFLLVGSANTGVTVVLLALLARVIDPSLAYTIVFGLGLAFTTVMANRYIFSVATSRWRMGLFLAWYLGVYLVGLGVVQLLDHEGHWSTLPLAVGTVMVTAPLSFLGGRLIFRGTKGPTPQGQELTQ